MEHLAFFDTKPYDREWFDRLNQGRYQIIYFESKLRPETARLAQGCAAVCAFVNDQIDGETIALLAQAGVRVIAMRSAGYNNVACRAARGKLKILRVPAYSPYAVAEHTMALLLSLNRKLHKAYHRTRDFNFSLTGLTGMDLHGKTVGVVGTGKIGQVFVDICRGFGMEVIAFDPCPITGIRYVAMEELLRSSDVISLHCPLTEQTYHILDRAAFAQMKPGVFLLNTSRGALIDSAALLDALNLGTVQGAGLDVYEEEADFFFEDFSGSIVHDNTLALLVSRPNVVITSHQGFLTQEALENIAAVTLDNLDAFFGGKALRNEVCTPEA